MQYRGKYAIFDASLIKTYPLSTRSNRVKLESLISPERMAEYSIVLPKETQRNITTVAQSVVSNQQIEQAGHTFCWCPLDQEWDGATGCRSRQARHDHACGWQWRNTDT